jgi:RNA polymerase sigma-70 factor (ECF subfamily)
MNYEELPDEELAERYYAGDDRAFAELYRRYFPELVLYFLRSVRDRHLAEDLAEETFLRLVGTKASGRGRYDRRRGAFRPWLYRVAYNVLQDHWREVGRRPLAVTDPRDPGDGGSLVENLPDDEPGPEDLLFARELEEVIRDCIRQLPEGEWGVYVLRVLVGFSTRDTAEILGIPPGTVGTRLQRARVAVARCVRQRWEQGGPGAPRPL